MVSNFVLGDNALSILETGNHYGNMNTAKKFYPEDYTSEMRWSSFLKRRIELGMDAGFDGHKMFMADQTHENGSWFEITKDYVDANSEGWTDIPEDILVITDKVPGVVIGHPVADCPVVMAYDSNKHYLAIGHCSAELVDKKMPMLVVEALRDSHDLKEEDISVYVSACAGKSWTYDRYPAWAKDDNIWKDVINMGDDGLYHIDLKKAVLKQLKELELKEIMMNNMDTITNRNFYSNSAARNDPSKAGRNFAGGFFVE